MNTNNQPPPEEQNLFLSPCLTIPVDKQHKTTVIVNLDDFNKVQQYRMRPGTFTRTISILTKKLITALEHYGLDKYDPDAYERFLSQCHFTIDDIILDDSIGNAPTRRSAQQQPVSSPSETHRSDERRRVERVSSAHENTPPVNANPKRTLRRGGSEQTSKAGE